MHAIVLRWLGTKWASHGRQLDSRRRHSANDTNCTALVALLSKCPQATKQTGSFDARFFVAIGFILL